MRPSKDIIGSTGRKRADEIAAATTVFRVHNNNWGDTERLEMGKNRHLLGSVLFGFYDYHGSVRVRVLLGNVTFM